MSSLSEYRLMLERIALTLWVGGLWVVGYLVVPIIFASLSERALAGELAGHLFAGMAHVGTGCGLLLLILGLQHRGRGAWRAWRFVLVLVMLGITLVGAWGLTPLMHALKSAAQNAPLADVAWQRFGMLHAVASLLFLINSVLGLVLVAAGTRADLGGQA